MLLGSGFITITNSHAQCSPDLTPPVFTFCPPNIILTTNSDTNYCAGRRYNWNDEIVDQQTSNTGSAGPTTDRWQSFTANNTGAFTAVTLYHCSASPMSTQITIYSGVGTGGTVLYNQTQGVANPCGGGVKISFGNIAPGLIAGQQYTIRLQTASNSAFLESNTNAGTFNSAYGAYPPTIGLAFKVHIAPNKPTGADNCNLVAVNSSHTPNSYFPVGTTTVTHTAIDNAGNTSQCSFNITVVDTHSPTIYNVPSNITVNNTTGLCGANVNWIPTPAATVVDQQNVNNLGVGQSDTLHWQSFVAGIYGKLTKISFYRYPGANSYTFTIFKGVGVGGPIIFNQAYTFFTSGIQDFNIPVISQPTLMPGQNYTFRIRSTTNNAIGMATTASSLPSRTFFSGGCSSCWLQDMFFQTYVQPINYIDAVDACGVTFTPTQTPGSFFPIGTTTVTYTATNSLGNSGTAAFNITVNDTQGPTPDAGSLPNVTGQCSATVLTTPTGTDNCSGAATGTTTDPLTYNTEGTYTVHWKYTDATGNTSTQNQLVIVDDNIAPVANAGSLPTLTGQCSVTVSTVPTANDNCSGTINATTTSPLTYNTDGTYTVVWKYDDGRGNTSLQNQTVIVDDNIAPVADLASLPTITGVCSATVSTIPTATDNCAGAITATTTSPLTYNTDGTYTVVWKYNDGRGNTSLQNQTVIVDDAVAPVPNMASLPTLTNECSVTLTAPTATDNCTGTVTATTINPISYNVDGSYNVIWTYNDGRGNMVTQNQTVIIDDVTAPIPNVPVLPTINQQCSATLTTPSATDNCAGTIIATTVNPTTYSAEGTYNVTWTYNDGRGNTTTQNQTVIIDDVTAPVPNVGSLPNATGQCSVNVTAPVATDNCVGTVTGTTVDPTSYSLEGTYTIHWLYDDGRGNISGQNQTVIVDDITSPVPNTPSLTTITGECSVSWFYQLLLIIVRVLLSLPRLTQRIIVWKELIRSIGCMMMAGEILLRKTKR